MATATVEEAEADAPAPAASKPRKRGRLVLFIVLGVLLAASGAAGWYFLMRGTPAEGEGAEEAAAHAGPPMYVSLEPAMVVNFSNPMRARYLQISLDAMARDAEAIEAVKAHMPAIRNNLMLLFSTQDYKVLVTREGKEAMRAAALHEIQAVLEKQIGRQGVEEVYFTSFVMQ